MMRSGGGGVTDKVRHTIRYTICHSGKLLSYNVLHAAVTV